MVGCTASFSTCRNYRWSLTRYIDNSQKEIIFIGLNPSSANRQSDDPTTSRLVKFSKTWGYGSLVVVNLFAKIATSPNLLTSCQDPVGSRNDYELNKRINYWSRNDQCDLWLGWGAKGHFMNRDYKILRKIKHSLKKPYVIGLIKGGHPRHPLYVSNQKSLFPFDI